MRSNNRKYNEIRKLNITKQYTKYAEGSVLIEMGDTKVLCNASIISGVPPFLRGTGQGWITAEYGMLPRSTHTRMFREASKGKQSGRTQEIQRLIGRSLRAAIDLNKIPGYTITVDCDVIQADGGTRTAAISGASIAIFDAINIARKQDLLEGCQNPLKTRIAAISVGICHGNVVLDLDYDEDSNADTDMNIVMNDQGGIIEIQGTAEKEAFDDTQLAQMISLAKTGIQHIFDKVK